MLSPSGWTAAAGVGVSGIGDVLSGGSVRSVLQPIVDLDTGQVVAYEALARGPRGSSLERPDRLFAAARSVGRLAELDELCRRAALHAAAAQGVTAPLTLFVNVEPEVLDAAPVDDLLAIAEGADGDVQVVMEITERAIAARPAELLRTVERVRALGWRVALDDVGADPMSLAFMPLLQPEVVKLDLRLVQERPGPAIAEIMNAVNAYAERSGAVLLAEGIEDSRHLAVARALGARLGQGWLFGRPQAERAAALPHGELRLPRVPARDWSSVSPFSCLPPSTALRRSEKRLLIELSKHLEREALRHGGTCVVAAAFQEARHFTAHTGHRYRELAERIGFVAAIGEGLPAAPVSGVRGADLDPADPVRGEWDIVVLSPHFSAALLARDLGDLGPDRERTFEFGLTYDRDVVAAAAQALLGRVAPRLPVPAGLAEEPRGTPAGTGPALAAVAGPGAPAGTAGGGELLLRRALSATSNGVTITDMTHPEQPLVYVNTAFERLSGLRAEEVLGRNCRFLQGEATDPAAVRRIREAVDAGRECRERLLNHRGPERIPWWNEVYLSPVFDETARVVQYIGVQSDVTAQVEAEQALRQERDRVQSFAERVSELALTDPLTGLSNRRSVQDVLETVLLDARVGESSAALLYLDLDGFKAVNDELGHGVGDEVLRVVARRLRARLRRGDCVARLGGDEFLVVLPGLEPGSAGGHAEHVAASLAAAVREPVLTDRGPVRVGTSVGIALVPEDGETYDELLRTADARMYVAKRAARL
jgi:diguanylate cyclase (GGDEF)-like protein/PAS domain S-box-containing protein